VKFSSDGKVMGAWNCKAVPSHRLLAISGDQTLYVFDQAASEIVVYSALDGSPQIVSGALNFSNWII
jgi:hypothetical protein